MITKTRLLQELEELNQEHIVRHLENLPVKEKNLLLKDLESLDFSLLKRQQQTLLEETSSNSDELTAFTDARFIPQAEQKEKGEQLLEEGKVGCLLVAGGQGSRLGFTGPKGLYPLKRIREKSLFQIFCERVIAASMRYGKKLPLAIMTSKENRAATEKFFSDNHYFGLSSQQLSFFSQNNLPCLDQKGKLFLQNNHSLAQAPDGNGKALLHFYQSGPGKDWAEQGIETVSFIQVDNPLADPFDATLIGEHHTHGNCVTIKTTEKKAPEEAVGVLAYRDNRLEVIEYTELPKEQAYKTDETNRLLFNQANLSLFCFSLSFIKKISSKFHKRQELHTAWKKIPFYNKEGKTESPSNPNAWKFEYFIFDVLPFTQKASALCYPRKLCFSPLKNANGSASPEEVIKDLFNFDRITYEEISGISAKKIPFELSPKFYYPTEKLKQKWKGKVLPEDTVYIEP